MYFRSFPETNGTLDGIGVMPVGGCYPPIASTSKNHPYIQLQPLSGSRRDSSILLLRDGDEFQESGAIARILIGLPDGWPLLGYAIILVPSLISNRIYRYVARNRYKWFGVRDECRLPSDSEKSRFLP